MVKKSFKKNSEIKEFKSIIIRYSLILLIGIFGISIFYLIFTPLTIYSVYFILKLVLNATLVGGIISIGQTSLEIIPACVAGSAYYLLFILNVSIPKISFTRRIKMILFSSLLLLAFNILRILFLAFLAYSNSIYLEITHKLFWYFLNTLFIVGIWFFEVYLFKLKEIPVYSDLKKLYSKSIFKK